MDNRIDQVIAELSKIEASAVKIKEEAELEKTTYANEVQHKTKEFDADLAKKSAEKLSKINEELQAEKKAQLTEWREETTVILSHLDESYEKKHTEWATTIMNNLINDSVER